MKMKRTSAGLVAVNLVTATLLSATAFAGPMYQWVSFGSHVAMMLLWFGVWIGETDSTP
jgi:hypothetical protein